MNHEDVLGSKSKRTAKKSSKFLDSEAMKHESKKEAKSGVKSKKSAGFIIIINMCNCSLHIINLSVCSHQATRTHLPQVAPEIYGCH